jgi:hypothetical protein
MQRLKVQQERRTQRAHSTRAMPSHRAQEEIYSEIATSVFAPGSVWRQLRHGHSCDSGPLVRVLQDVLGKETPMRMPGGGARPAAFVVTTRREVPAGGGAEKLELRVLRTYNSSAPSGGRDALEGWRQWEAAVATSAAPTILPPFRRADGTTFVDGALSGNNNPSLLVLTEGLQLAAGRQPIDIVLSLGCGEPPGGGSASTDRAATPAAAGSVLFWLGQVVSLAFDTSLQEERTVRLMGLVCPTARYLRLSPPLRADCALAEHRDEALAALRADTAASLTARGDDIERLAAWLSQDDVEDEAGGGLLPGTGQLSEALLL